MSDAPKIGDVLLMRLPTHTPRGHEQQGPRPVVVIAEPDRAGQTRYPMVFGAPLTSQLAEWQGTDRALYPVLQRGVGGLPRDSVVLLEHARGIDAARVTRRLGTLSSDEYKPIRDVLEVMFGFKEDAS